MKIIDPKKRDKPYITKKSHFRLKHTHQRWHPEIPEKQRKKEEKRLNKLGLGNRIPFEFTDEDAKVFESSTFDSYLIARDAIEKSYFYPAEVKKNGNLVITFSHICEVGYDARKERRTTAVTVVTKLDGEVITAHPGLPSS